MRMPAEHDDSLHAKRDIILDGPSFGDGGRDDADEVDLSGEKDAGQRQEGYENVEWLSRFVS